MAHVVVTGSSGHLGEALVRVLREARGWLGWRMFPGIDRVYVNNRARSRLGWVPRYDFRHVLDCLKGGEDPRSPLARAIGAKGYHDQPTGVYTL